MGGPSGVLAVVLLEIALGSVAVLWVTPVWGIVKRGFFLLVGWTVLVCAATAGLLIGFDDWLGAFLALALVFVAALHLKRMAVARVAGMLAVPAGVLATVAIADAGGGDPVKGTVAMLAGAAFLGATWVGMVLGHWYLVDRKLTPRPMRAYATAFSVTTAVALVSAALTRTGQPTAALAGFNPTLYVYGLAPYLAFGLIAVNGLLAFFVHKLVGEGSIRAATGMLYLAVIMSWSAEFAAKALFFTT